MSRERVLWKKGRGNLGPLKPLLGTWSASADSPQGRVRSTRSFRQVLASAYVELTAQWKFGGTVCEELAVYGAGPGGKLTFWSFTSDGKRSEGKIADVRDVHPQAVGFEANMPAGRARTAYWPDEEGGFFWAVEAKTKEGWKRFTEHHCTKV